MWRSLGNRSFQKIKFLSSDFCSVSNKSFVGSQDSSFFGRISSFGDSPCNVNRFWHRTGGVHRFCSRFEFSNEGNFGNFRGFSSAVEAIVSTEDESEVEELNNQMAREMKVVKQPKLVGGITRRKYLLLWRRQMKMETEAWMEAAKEYQELIDDMCKQKLAPDLPFMKSLFLGWFEPFRDAIAAEQESCRQGGHKRTYGPYLVRLPANMIAVITMHKLMGLLMTTGVDMNSGCRVVHAALQIGEAVEQEVRIQNFLNKTKRKSASSKDINKESDSPTEQQEKLRKKFTCLMKKKMLHQVQSIVKEHDHGKPWGQEVQVKVGSRLIQLLMETAYIQSPVDHSEDGPPDIRPAFIHNLESVDTGQGIKTYGFIECDPLVRKGLERTPRHMVLPYMPMLVPPMNWTGYDKGAYLCLPSYIMRTHGAKEQREAIKRVSKKQIEPIFEALNTLGHTKWRINKRILDIVDRIWASGGRIAGLVDREDLDLPKEPYTEDEAVTRKWRWKIREAKKVNSERHSQRCDIELKLAVSRKLKDEDGFYYPHNLDFRGRAYPLHPYLNHLGSDLCRGILEFAEGRPLGKSGLRWLKIHLANLYAGGVDKFSYEGRVAFTEEHLDDIFDSADRPLDGKQWWLKAEEPFQCLATCINLSEALRSSSPESTLSYIPIHQDGSCNGLQHYAALGRDKVGAAAVNLVAGEKPADVYSGVANRVLDIMQIDAAKDPASNPNVFVARLLVNQVDRKLVKQTVMTSVYGVTYIGARDQIKSRLKERGLIQDADKLFAAAWYATKTTLTALEELFQSARSIMSWLGDCAKVITMENQPVRWITPLGLPVVQPYRKVKIIKIRTSLQALTLHRETDKVFARQQRAAFPANFVHSLDGTHMMMTAIACKEAGLNFAGVHDSYWTHACDVDKMNIILREKFVELYETPILEDLQDSFQKTFPELDFPPLPERGDFDLNEVLKSPYFFN